MKTSKRFLCLSVILLLFNLSVFAETTTIDFTGGTVYLRDGTTGTTDTATYFRNVDYYTQDSFKFDYIEYNPDFIGSTFECVGFYYGSAHGVNDVLHGHFGTTNELATSIIVTNEAGLAFDLTDFDVTTNNRVQTGGLVYINSMADDGSVLYSQQLPESAWGTNDGVAHVVLGAQFENIKSFSFTYTGSAYCFGIDNLNIEVCTTVPAPGAILLSGIGVSMFGFVRRRIK